MDFYICILTILHGYFENDGWQRYFLSGGCFWLASYLQHGIKKSVIMINRVEEHCALYFEQGLYDVRGRISKYNFHRASERELRFMEKNYIPQFDVQKLEHYIQSVE